MKIVVDTNVLISAFVFGFCLCCTYFSAQQKNGQPHLRRVARFNFLEKAYFKIVFTSLIT